MRFALLLVLLASSFAHTASAQDWADPEGGETGATDTSGEGDWNVEAGATTTGTATTGGFEADTTTAADSNWGNPDAPAGTEAKKSSSGSDHSTVAPGHIGVGWFGMNSMPWVTATFDATAGRNVFSPTTIDVPMIGVRWWLSETLGLDVALGFWMSSGSTETDSSGTAGTGITTVDTPGILAFMLHGGVPLVFYHSDHYKFLLVPEVEFGYGSGDDGADAVLSSLLVSVGARIGSEIHFGFIGIPQLSIQASVGLGLAFTSSSVDDCPMKNAMGNADCNAENVITTNSNMAIRTLDLSEPWDIFKGNIAAIYYF